MNVPPPSYAGKGTEMSGWTAWKGGECPLQPDQKFDARWYGDDEHIYAGASAWEWPQFFDVDGSEIDGGGDPYATEYRLSLPAPKEPVDGRE